MNMETAVKQNGIVSVGETTTTWSPDGEFKKGLDGKLIVLDKKKFDEWSVNRIAPECKFFDGNRCRNKRLTNGHVIDDSRSSAFFCGQCSRD